MSAPSREVRIHLAVLFLVVTLLVALAAASPARATTFGADSVASASASTLAADAYQPVISQDAAFVVWVGSLNGVQGIWETNRASGAVTAVAGANASSGLNAPDAGSPSVSANGQYVAFTTTADLDPVDDPGQGCSSVYVRNMSISPGQSGAYVLASALNARPLGLTYAGTNPQQGQGTCPGGGSAAAYKVAISADGSEVAFTVIGQSDLTTGVAADLATPADQVAVRNLKTDTTTLVSQTQASEQSGLPAPVPNGAAMSYTGTQPGAGASTASHSEITGTATINGLIATVPISASTAAISADGSTVAWMGIDIPDQAPADAASTSQGGDAPAGFAQQFDEPLWRDIAAGPTAPTRRITGGDDPGHGQGPFDEDLNIGDSTQPGPSDGTLIAPALGTVDEPTLTYGQSTLPLDEATPQLSADGQEVAFLADAYPYGQVPSGSGTNGSSGYGPTDAYVVDMASGLTRVTALTQLTQVASEGTLDLAISPDGTKVAFTTADTAFPLASPSLITPALTQVDATQLYEADLSTQTVSLISYGYDANPADGSILEPSFSGDGDTLAFASAADNLVYGAYNGTSANGSSTTLVFTTTQLVSPAVPSQSTIGPGPAALTLKPLSALSVVARANRDGSVKLDVDVPGPGTVTAAGRGLITSAHTVQRRKVVRVPVRITVKPKRPGAKATKRLVFRRRIERIKVIRRSDATRTIASARRSAPAAGQTELTLTPARGYRAELTRPSGLYATIVVRFAAAGQATLSQTVQLTLHDRSAGASKVKAAEVPR